MKFSVIETAYTKTSTTATTDTGDGMNLDYRKE